jgi:hypothetical protein
VEWLSTTVGGSFLRADVNGRRRKSGMENGAVQWDRGYFPFPLYGVGFLQ